MFYFNELYNELPIGDRDKILSDCVSFVFYPGEEKVLSYEENRDSALFDMPFKYISMEMFENPVTVYANYKGAHKAIEAKCLLLFEIEPGSYFCIVYTNNKENRFYTERGAANTLGFGDLIRYFLNRLKKENVGLLQKRSRVRNFGGQKVATVTKKVCYVSDKKPNIQKMSGGGNIVFSHRFLVGGTWVKLHNPSTIGKDRAGAYTMQNGYTWRTEHIKGPKDAPLVKKDRIVKAKQTLA